MGNLFKLCFLLFALSASVFVSCTPENNGDGSLETVPLPSPSVTVQEQDETSFTLVWSPVTGAAHYSYRCDWTESSSITQDTVLSFMDLAPDSTYVVWLSVQGIARGGDQCDFEQSRESSGQDIHDRDFGQSGYDGGGIYDCAG